MRWRHAGRPTPGLLERLRQNISVRAMMAGDEDGQGSRGYGQPIVEECEFLAPDWPVRTKRIRASRWRWPLPAVSGKSFASMRCTKAGSPTKVPKPQRYTFIWRTCCALGSEHLHSIRSGFERHFDGHAEYYRGQPPEIRALMPNRGNMDLYFLSPHTLLERACDADPSPRISSGGSVNEESSPATCDDVAERWSAALPKDIAPLMHLMQSAENRNALQKAFKLMEQAERVDGLNAEVRRARLRLLVSITARHLRAEKPNWPRRTYAGLKLSRKRSRATGRLSWRPCASSVASSREPRRKPPPRRLKRCDFGRRDYRTDSHSAGGGWCGRPYSALGDAPPPTVPLFAAMGRVCAHGRRHGHARRVDR